MKSTTPEMATVHGHEVIHLIHDASPRLTREALHAAVSQRFGPDARFHTCSAGGMSLDQLLHFLIVRGKVVEADGLFQAVIENVCEDGQ
jgi:probable metal-binding protein